MSESDHTKFWVTCSACGSRYDSFGGDECFCTTPLIQEADALDAYLEAHGYKDIHLTDHQPLAHRESGVGGFFEPYECFEGLEKKDPAYAKECGKGDECPSCKGHGYYVLMLNAYGKPGDSPLVRHFLGSCGACWGWGYLEKNQTCLHEWSKGQGVGNCLREWACTKCGSTHVVDSSG